jgi:hypothetical protein
MKELLSKLIKSYVVIGFKSGDKIENAVIESIIGNVLVVTYNEGIAMIEIPHIAYVKTEGGDVDVMESILSSGEDKEDGSNDSKKDNGKDDKKKRHHHHH